jgi:hypothetical protein
MPAPMPPKGEGEHGELARGAFAGRLVRLIMFQVSGLRILESKAQFSEPEARIWRKGEVEGELERLDVHI